MLFTEHIPHTVNTWLGNQAAVGAQTAATAYAMVEQGLQAGAAFMGDRGLLHFDAHFDNLLTDGRRLYFADFGLATCIRFALSPAESTFHQRHRTYDRTYTATHLVRSMVTTLRGGTPQKRDAYLRDCATGQGCGELPGPAASIVMRYAPIAVVMGEFFRKLQTISRTTPYPVDEIERVCRG